MTGEEGEKELLAFQASQGNPSAVFLIISSAELDRYRDLSSSSVTSMHSCAVTGE